MSTMMERRLRSAAVAAVVGLGGVVAVGGAGEAFGSQAQPNACALFSRKDAKKIIGKAVRRETDITGTEASTCGYASEKDPKRVVSLSVGEFASDGEASKAYTRARANAKFDGLKVETVRRLGNRAHWLPKTNNFEQTVLDQPVTFGELTVRQGCRVYTIFLAPPSKSKARDAINLVIAD
ncbi:MAG TPA: hypothetical protein VEM59_05610 [Acidimicrobiia bacterium]|nr:hypothetical protein [Acidimicrobiia bacterium]